jgi:hypothetical protein
VGAKSFRLTGACARRDREEHDQGRGEASVTLRNDGSAGLIYFEPGSLGEETSPSWLIAEFPSAGRR